MNADANVNGSVTITINNAEPLSANNDRYIAIDSSATLNRDHFMPMTCGNVVVSAPSCACDTMVEVTARDDPSAAVWHEPGTSGGQEKEKGCPSC